MLDFASKRKEAELRSGIVRNNSFWDKVIFRKIQVCLKASESLYGGMLEFLNYVIYLLMIILRAELQKCLLCYRTAVGHVFSILEV